MADDGANMAWSCAFCKVEHEGDDAVFLTCKMCGSKKDSADGGDGADSIGASVGGTVRCASPPPAPTAGKLSIGDALDRVFRLERTDSIEDSLTAAPTSGGVEPFGSGVPFDSVENESSSDDDDGLPPHAPGGIAFDFGLGFCAVGPASRESSGCSIGRSDSDDSVAGIWLPHIDVRSVKSHSPLSALATASANDEKVEGNGENGDIVAGSCGVPNGLTLPESDGPAASTDDEVGGPKSFMDEMFYLRFPISYYCIHCLLFAIVAALRLCRTRRLPTHFFAQHQLFPRGWADTSFSFMRTRRGAHSQGRCPAESHTQKDFSFQCFGGWWLLPAVDGLLLQEEAEVVLSASLAEMIAAGTVPNEIPDGCFAQSGHLISGDVVVPEGVVSIGAKVRNPRTPACRGVRRRTAVFCYRPIVASTSNGPRVCGR
jgi:hypothetical protein